MSVQRTRESMCVCNIHRHSPFIVLSVSCLVRAMATATEVWVHSYIIANAFPSVIVVVSFKFYTWFCCCMAVSPEKAWLREAKGAQDYHAVLRCYHAVADSAQPGCLHGGHLGESGNANG